MRKYTARGNMWTVLDFAFIPLLSYSGVAFLQIALYTAGGRGRLYLNYNIPEA